MGALADAGVAVVGENRAQDMQRKHELYGDRFRWHFIGALQSNKARRAALLADVVQSVDSADLARRLSRAAAESGKTLRVLLEVNLGGEGTKAGIAERELAPLVDEVRGLPSLDLRGLMAIPPPGDTRPYFARLRELAASHALPELSMGMSDDFEAAVEEGATLVRVGSAIFGAR